MKSTRYGSSMKMSIIQALSEAKRRPLRLGFSRYLSERYGMSQSTAYQKIRLNRVKKWELTGIASCIDRFMPGYTGDLSDFYGNLANKGKFLTYMSTSMGMGERTARDRFRDFDFTELEIKGLEKIYNEYKRQLEVRK